MLSDAKVDPAGLQGLTLVFSLAFGVNRVKAKSNSSLVSNCSLHTMGPIVCYLLQISKAFYITNIFLVKSLC